jgi:RNA polymerase sigma-70 factor (sigma-E family)
MEADERFRAAFERHYDGVFRVALLMTGSPEEADDVVQEAFVRARTRLAGLAPDEQRPYLRAVVVNECRTRGRRARDLRLRLPFLVPSTVVAESAFEDRDAIWTAVLRLPPRQRACVVLRFYEDLPLGEIAAVLGCSVGTVKSQLHRGLAHIREVTSDEDRG